MAKETLNKLKSTMKNILITLSLVININLFSMRYLTDCIPSCCRESYGIYTNQNRAREYFYKPERTTVHKHQELTRRVKIAGLCSCATCIACLPTETCSDALCYGYCASNMYLMTFFIAKGTQELCQESLKYCIAKKYGLEKFDKKGKSKIQ